MSSNYWDHTPKPLNASHDYEFRKINDERYYEILESEFLTQHRCTFPIEALSSGRNRVTDFDPCKKNITFKIPPTKGTDWHQGSINQRYKDQETPRVETVTFPLWSKLWTQYKIDKYEFMCENTATYKNLLDDINMKELNDLLLSIAIRLLGTYENVFCSPCARNFGSETDPIFMREGSTTMSDYLFDRADEFNTTCLPGMGWMALFPLCAKSLFLRDDAINELYSECCKEVNPALSGMMPDFINNINGVTPVFLKDEFFDSIDLDGQIAYKIPVFHADALAYHPAFMDSVEIGEDKEEDGKHFRRNFFYFMQVVQEEMVTNDWIVFEKSELPRVSTANAPQL